MTPRGASMQQLVMTCLVMLGLAFPLETVAMLWLVCAGCLAWLLIGATYLSLQFFYHGLRYGEWT